MLAFRDAITHQRTVKLPTLIDTASEAEPPYPSGFDYRDMDASIRALSDDELMRLLDWAMAAEAKMRD